MKKNKNISQQVAGGVAWMLVLRMSLRALGLVNTVILARLLSPEDFGLVAIAMSFFALLYLIKDFGFDTVIVQMRDSTREHYDTAWTFNLIFGIGLALVLLGSSGILANVYETPALQPLICAIASLFIIGGLESVGTLDFQKNLTFDKEFKLKILPKLIGVPCTLMMAYWLRSYWALTIGTIVTQLSALCMGYLMHSYRPKFSITKAKELFNFSKWLMANNLIYFINNRSPELFIGKLLSPHAAGFFSVSSEIALMTTTEFSAAVSYASYPGYAKVAQNPNDLRNLYLNVLSSTSFLLFPMAIGIASIAGLIVPIFLGDQWLEITPLIKVIVIGGLFMAINSNSGYVFMALGNPRLSTILGTVRILIFIPALIYLVSTQGLIGSAWAILVTSGVMFCISNLVVIYRLPITLVDLMKAFYRPFLSAILMMLVLAQLPGMDGLGTLQQNIWRLGEALIIGVAVYFITVFLLWMLAKMPEGPEFKLYKTAIHRYWRSE